MSSDDMMQSATSAFIVAQSSGKPDNVGSEHSTGLMRTLSRTGSDELGSAQSAGSAQLGSPLQRTMSKDLRNAQPNGCLQMSRELGSSQPGGLQRTMSRDLGVGRPGSLQRTLSRDVGNAIQSGYVGNAQPQRTMSRELRSGQPSGLQRTLSRDVLRQAPRKPSEKGDRVRGMRPDQAPLPRQTPSS